jgi:poly-beta-1,6-N-acetyl-D-glucosamine synthase
MAEDEGEVLGMNGLLGAIVVTSAVVVGYTYLGYPALLRVLARKNQGVIPPANLRLPDLSLVVPMHNEANVIAEKIANTAALEYPRDLLHVVVVDDGSTDATVNIVQKRAPEGWRLTRNPYRRGKPSVLNQAIANTTSELVVLSDADTLLPPGSLLALAAAFGDARVGAVTGEVQMVDAEGPAATESTYWRFENGVKRSQSSLGMVIGGSGGTVAFRRDLYTPLPPDCLVDEFDILVRLSFAGYLVRDDPSAVALHRSTPSIRLEFSRRVRIVCGGWQSMVRTATLALRAPRTVQFHYVSHRVLRWAVTPYLIALSSVAAPLLAWQSLLFIPVVTAELLGALLVLVGGVAVGARRQLPAPLLVPFTVAFLNIAAVGGLLQFLAGRQSVRWSRPPRQSRAVARVTTEIYEDPDTVSIGITGELRGRGSRELSRVWTEWRDRIGPRRLVLDCSNVRGWDVRGLLAFVGVVTEAAEYKVDLGVVGIPLEALNAASLAGVATPVLSGEPRVTSEAGVLEVRN